MFVMSTTAATTWRLVRSVSSDASRRLLRALTPRRIISMGVRLLSPLPPEPAEGRLPPAPSLGGIPARGRRCSLPPDSEAAADVSPAAPEAPPSASPWEAPASSALAKATPLLAPVATCVSRGFDCRQLGAFKALTTPSTPEALAARILPALPSLSKLWSS